MHVTCSLASRLVGDCGAVVRIGVVDMLRRRHDRSMNCSIASQFIGDQPPWFPILTFEQAVEKPFCCTLIAAALHEKINDIPVLVAGAHSLAQIADTTGERFQTSP